MSETIRTRIGGDYEILAQLGRGGMAEVFKARHRRLGRTVALKVLPTHVGVDDEDRSRFEREARAGALLEHDHIVTTYDFGIYDGRPYLAVAFVEGETLAARIRRQGRLSPQETVRLLAPIAEALAYAHRKGVIHRDVKSSNIMIRAEDQRPVLIDFGVAQAAFTQKLTRRGDTLGTPEYMSPEQARAREIDFRSDLYSLGVVLYECLTGTLPFQSPNTEVLLANIKYEAHPSVRKAVPETPAALSAVVDQCLAKEPGDRFPDGDALAHALREGLTEERRRRPIAAWVLGLVLVAALAAGGVGYSAGWFGSLAEAPQPPPAGEEDPLLPEDTTGTPVLDEEKPPPPEGPTLNTLLASALHAYMAQQYSKAVTLFTQAADSGAAEAQFWLGTLYLQGLGVLPDTAQAVAWYRRAAGQGYAEAKQALQRLTQSLVIPAGEDVPPGSPPPPEDEPEPDVYFQVDAMPELLGGIASIQRAIRYPEAARRQGVQGSVIVKFVVDARGAVAEATVVQGIGFGCDEEALRVVQTARFKPGVHEGKPVRVQQSLTITFKLN